MHLDNGHRDCGNSIEQHHRGVRIATSIKHHTIILAIGTLKRIDKLALDVRLVVVDIMLLVTCTKSSEVILEAFVSVYLGLATPQ